MGIKSLRQIKANSISKVLSKKDFFNKSSIKTDYGDLIPIEKLNVNSNLPENYQSKKAMFWLGKSVVVIHYWGENYVKDDFYFRRLYQNSKKVYQNKLVPTPELIDYDDKNMILVTERVENDLSIYLSSKKREEIETVIDKCFNLFYSVWEKTKETKMGFPRYVSFFLKPEYSFLRTRKIDDYLPKDLTEAYKLTQVKLNDHLNSIKKTGFESGFGLADVKLDNLVEDKNNILFIDVEKPEKVHWLTLAGQLYQRTVFENKNPFFIKILREKSDKILKKEKNQEMAIRHFNLGRMNRLLLAYTLRNISYCVEINEKIDFEGLNKSLKKVQTLL